MCFEAHLLGTKEGETQMRVLVVIKKSPAERYLIQLLSNTLIKEVKSLIDTKQHSQAVVTVLKKGIFERDVSHEELHSVAADVILSEHNVSWDLTK